jgi:hypothetical protein
MNIGDAMLIKNCALVLLLLLMGFSLAEAASLEYTVMIEKGTSTAHVSVVARKLTGELVELVFRSEAAYVSSYVSNFTSSAGTPKAMGEGRWSVRTSRNRLSYEYDITKVIPWRANIPWGTSDNIAVYIDDECGVIMAPYFFIYPARQEFTFIRVEFDVPTRWQVVTPYIPEGDSYGAQKVTQSLLNDFICRQQIYMGPMRFYAERDVAGCVVKFGKLAADDNNRELTSQKGVDAYVDATARTISALTDLFGENPYGVFTMYANFFHNVGSQLFKFEGTRYMGNGYQYWPEHRWDELVGHAALAWIGGPLLAEFAVVKGIYEDYYGQLLAWELFSDPAYLAKMYLYFLMYEWIYDHHDRNSASYLGHRDEYDAYFRWEFIGLLLDREIQQKTNNEKSLCDALRWLYGRYANSGYIVKPSDLEQAIHSATGVSVSDLFSRYVYGQAKLPVYRYLATYKSHFLKYSKTFTQVFGHEEYCGHTIPFFIQIVLAAALSEHLPWGLLCEEYPLEFATHVLRNYDLDTLSEKDVIEALSTLTGADCSDFFTDWEGSYGRLTLVSIVDWLRDFSSGCSSQRASEATTDSAGRLREAGFTDAGTISWTGPLKQGEPKELTITVYDESYITWWQGKPTTQFWVEFDSTSGWGHTILGIPVSQKEKWSWSIKFFEEVRIVLTKSGDSWIGTVTIVPRHSVRRLAVGPPPQEDRPFFGVDVFVL